MRYDDENVLGSLANGPALLPKQHGSPRKKPAQKVHLLKKLV
jgi:hypothetical protein